MRQAFRAVGLLVSFSRPRQRGETGGLSYRLLRRSRNRRGGIVDYETCIKRRKRCIPEMPYAGEHLQQGHRSGRRIVAWAASYVPASFAKESRKPGRERFRPSFSRTWIRDMGA